MVKFINNFLAQVTPFLFYSIGGYLALQGRLDIGQLVAVINAYKDLPGPLKDLIDWDQSRQDVQVKYNQVVEQFSVDRLIDPQVQALSTEPAERLAHALVATNLTISTIAARACWTTSRWRSIPAKRLRSSDRQR